VILEDEPRFSNPEKLMNMKTYARHARTSILGHNTILWGRNNVIPRSVEDTTDLGIEEDDDPVDPRRQDGIQEPEIGTTTCSVPAAQPRVISGQRYLDHEALQQNDAISQVRIDTFQQEPVEDQIEDLGFLDFFRPFHDPEMLDVFPHGQPIEFAYFDTSPRNLDFWDQWSTGEDTTTRP
jgi:hypothetical protein